METYPNYIFLYNRVHQYTCTVDYRYLEVKGIL